MQILALWLILRILTSLWAAVVSTIRPLSPIEQAIPLWPPAANLGAWLERVFLAPWLRWDTEWFVKIVVQGYHAEDGTAAFHPLYSWLAMPLAHLGINPLLSLMLVSTSAVIIFLWIYRHLASLDLSWQDTSFSLTMLLFCPMSFILFAPYTEGLYLLWVAVLFLAARQRKWWLAGLAGGLAALTRQQGILLIVPLAIELWQSASFQVKVAWNNRSKWLSLLLIPAGLGVWLIYRGLVLNDVQWTPFDIPSFIYTIFLSPSTHKVSPIFHFTWPWEALSLALNKIQATPDVDIWINIILAILFVIAAIIAWKRMRLSYRAYTLMIFLISFSDYTGPIHPYMGLPRHLYLAFPIFLGLAPIVRNRWLRLAVVGLGTTGLLFLTLQYVLHSWVP